MVVDTVSQGSLCATIIWLFFLGATDAFAESLQGRQTLGAWRDLPMIMLPALRQG